MILRLLLGAGIGSGVSWYLGRRDQRSLIHSAGIGAGAMLLSPLVTGKSGNLAGEFGAAPQQTAGGAGSTGFYRDEGGYGWYYDYTQKIISMMARPGGGARSLLKKSDAPDAYMKVWNAAIKGKTPTDRETVLAYATSKGGVVTGKAGAAQAPAKASSRASAPGATEAAAPPVEADFVDRAAAMIGATRTQLYIGAGFLVAGSAAAVWLSTVKPEYPFAPRPYQGSQRHRYRHPEAA